MWCCKQHAHASAAGDNCKAPVVSTLVHLNGSGLPPCPVRCSKPSLCSFLHTTQKVMIAGVCVSILPANSTHKYNASLCVQRKQHVPCPIMLQNRTSANKSDFCSNVFCWCPCKETQALQ